MSARISCLICFDTLTEVEHECRQCKVAICGGCMLKYVQSRITLGPSSLPCPHCQIPWFKPKFVIECRGGAYVEDVSFRISIGERFYVHGIHDGVNFVGYACVKHTSAFINKEFSYHINDISLLEPYAVGFDYVLHMVRCIPASRVLAPDGTSTSFSCIISTEDDFDQLKTSFESSGCSVLQVDECTMVTPDLEKFLQYGSNPF